ncbi:hypothetical protein [Draconibacterium mangrovi]|uniref:hypothetical protein n=1 Tax=Draconibacterium mangrovi TaxID=2697469 RepID=UPI0013D0CB1E|nr:hypothetical protein [Draconibacterium mangrovi]
MSYFSKPLLLVVSLIFVIKLSSAQESYPSKNIDINLKAALLEETPSFYGLELGHEWRIHEFFGVGVGGGFKHADNFSDFEILQDNFRADNIDYYKLEGRSTFVNGKITGYLPILYNDDDAIEIQLYATFFSGIASLRLTGQLDLVSPEETIINEADQRTQPFYGFDFGATAAFSEHFAMRIFIGGNSINFKEVTDRLNSQIANRPFRFGRVQNEPYFGIGLTYTYSQRKR